jgi:hypothetical protein
VFSSEYVGGMARLTSLCTVIIGAIYGIYEIDRYLKKTQLRTEVNASLQLEKNVTEAVKKLRYDECEEMN